jgi:hypothetical protein
LGRWPLGIAFASGSRPYIQPAQNHNADLRTLEAMPINAGTLLLTADKEGFERAAVHLSLGPAAERVMGQPSLGIAFSVRQLMMNNQELIMNNCSLFVDRPVLYGCKPARNDYKPAVNGYKPAKNDYKPAKNSFKPAVNGYKPAKNGCKPAENGSKPVLNGCDYVFIGIFIF